MTFPTIPPGAVIFIDANTLIYHFTNDPQYGTACTQLIKRVELKQLDGFTSAHVLADVAHRLMTLEAILHAAKNEAGSNVWKLWVIKDSKASR